MFVCIVNELYHFKQAQRGGLLRYSAGQRALACSYTSYRVCLAAAGTPSYAPQPPQPRAGSTISSTISGHAAAERVSSTTPNFRAHIFSFLTGACLARVPTSMLYEYQLSTTL